MSCLAYATADQAVPYASPQLKEGKFRNAVPRHSMGLLGTLKVMWDFTFHKPAGTAPAQALQVRALTREELLAAPDNSVFRLGHSTILLKLQGAFWLTDPVFSERASPVQWAGPARFHAPPISIQELPPIKGVILSHNHYDHLDHAAVLALAGKVEHFLAPLGVGDTLVAWGVPKEKVQQLDWWQSASVGGVQLTATPAQHFSGRGLFDGNKTLWSSWVIQSGEQRVFFSGDTGYFKGFKDIGDKFGPFDLTMMETGAYDPQWPDIHMQPHETMQAHIDLRGKVLMPIHNGTFDLAMHTWQDPFEKITALAAERHQRLATPAIGERLDVLAPAATAAWWREQQ
jgi:L-ascorbate metabolism protein UlaG (beta-lactamase superfamily)